MFFHNEDRPADFRKRLKQATLLQIALLAALMTAVVIISTGTGYIKVPAAAVVKVILAKLTGKADLIAGLDPIFSVVVMDVRLPRILSTAIQSSTTPRMFPR